MHQVLKGVAKSEQSQEQVQLTELVPMKRSRIKEDVLKDVDATDGLKALRSISNDCNDKSENLDVVECKNAKRQSERKSGDKHRQEQKVHRKRKSESKEEDTDPDDEEMNIDKVTRKKTEESRVNDKKLRGKNNTMIARKKPARSCKQTDDRKKRNNGSNKKNFSELKISLDDEFAPEDNDELYCKLNKKNCYNDEVYVYRQESVDPCSNSESKESDQETQDISYNTDSATDCQENVDDVTVNGSVKEKRKSNANGITKKMKKSKNELEPENDTSIEKDCHPKSENNNCLNGKKSRTSEEICATAGKPSKYSRKTPRIERSIKELSDGITKKHRPRLQNWQKNYCCVVCFARFQGSGGLRNHYKVLHSNGQVYKCNECGKEFPLKERLKLHVRTHTGFKPYKCPECDKCFARGGQLVQHRRTHTQEKPFQCDICSNRFTCAANLSLHIKRHKGQKDHKCELCGRGFVRRDALKKHLECLHRDVKSFVCVICNRTFKGHLPQHMRTHARDRPHGCATCGQRFAQKSQLTVHQRTHTGQRPFRCLVCWQAFAHSTALKLHTRRHTGERPFKCNECNAGFTQLPHWKKHMRCIHGRVHPYGCKWCTSFFRIKSELIHHKITCHPGMREDDSDTGGDGGVNISVSAGAGVGVNDGYDNGNNDGATAVTATAESLPSTSNDTEQQQQQPIVEKQSVTAKYKLMTVEKMRLLLAVLLKRISKKDKLKELGFGKRLIDEVLQDSLVSAGKEPVKSEEGGLTELEALTRNLEILLEWTVPKEHWETLRKMNKTPGDILEALTHADYDFG